MLGGESTQVVLSVRDLNSDNVPQKSWAAQHLAYTHGYGAIVAPANAKDAERRAGLRRQGRALRPTDQPALKLDAAGACTSARSSSSYVITGTKVREIDFQGEEGTEYTTYEGEDGVEARRPVQAGRVRAALRRPQPAASRARSPASSKVLYIRDIRERVEALAPFLHFDADPYPVILDGSHQVDARRLHDDEPLPVRADGPTTSSSTPAAGSTTASTTCATR